MRRPWTTYLAALLLGLITLRVQSNSQVVITSPKEGEVSLYRTQAVIGQAPAGLPVRLLVDDLVADSSKAMPNGAFEFLGIQTHEGPVKFVVVVEFPNGQTYNDERHMHILGAPDSIVVDLPSMDVPADGWTVMPVTVRLLDHWGVQIPNGYFVTISSDSMSIRGEDADSSTIGYQARLVDGKISFGLKAGRSIGLVTLTVSTNGITRLVHLTSKMPHIPLMVVASADATGKNQHGTASEKQFSSPDDFKDGVTARGRLAGIARGTVFDDYLMTLSVDTDRKIEDQIYRDLDPNTLYSMYGDNSIVTYEAQSTSPVYARLERDRSYLLYGDFNSLVTRNEFAAYNRSFTGARIHDEGKRYSFDLFGTVTNRKVIQEELRGQGISGYYYLRQNNLVTGSEKVRIEVRDRFHSEVVVTRKEKARYSDYEIDYPQGTLYFKQPIPSLDEQNNPVYIVISYEATTTSASNLVAGGAGEFSVLKNLTVGATTVLEHRTPRNYVLTGGNVLWQAEDLGTIRSELAHSYGVGTDGGAWKIEADLNPKKLFRLSPYYRKIDETFTNATQSGSGREMGTTKYGASFEIQAADGMKVGSEFYKQHQAVGSLSTDVQSLSGDVQQSIGKMGDVSVRLEDVKYDGLNPEAPSQDLNTHSTIISGTSKATVAEKLRASAGFEENLRKAERQVRPNSLTLGLEYDLTTAVTLIGQQKFLSEEGRLTSIGINTKVNDETSVYGRYELGGTIAGERNAATIGLKNIWKLTKELTSNISYEKTKNLSRNLVEARTPDHDAASLSLEYFPLIPLRATAKGEYFMDIANIRRGVDFGLTYSIHDGWSLLGKGTYFKEDSRLLSGTVRQSDYVGGVAYRPPDVNWLNLIGKVEYKIQQNSCVIPNIDYTALIGSMHMVAEPTTSMEVGVKYALKKSHDTYEGMSANNVAHFLLLRPQYDFTSFWNVAGEWRALYEINARNLSLGYSIETGFVVMKNTMLSAGYNFKAYRERDLQENVYSTEGPYITVRMKFTEDIFGLGSM